MQPTCFINHGGDPAAEVLGGWPRGAMPDGAARHGALLGWEMAPGARAARPREDHPPPLMVIAGAASGGPGHAGFHGDAPGRPIPCFRFGRPPFPGDLS